MSEMIRFPVEQMHAAARQIATSADNLGASTTSFWQRVQDSTTAFPPSVHDAAWRCLSPLHDHLLQILELQRSLANHLDASANLAAATERGATGAFGEKP